MLTFPNGLAHVHLTWVAGVRKVIYTIQGENGAITVDDDDMQIAVRRPPAADGSASWQVERRTVASEWMDASHTRWFNAMFDEFLAAIESGDHAGREARDAYRCIEIIDAAYASSAEGCRERPLGAPMSAARIPRRPPARRGRMQSRAPRR